MKETKSINNVVIRLTDERWQHILEAHIELENQIDEVLKAISYPDFICKGTNEEFLAAVYKYENKVLVVVYKEEIEDGFIITAYFTNKMEKLLKKEIIWRKQ
ncbi:MAG: hypothetical protein KDD21_01535 [Bacteroidetes bacterium]|nr:hypothetical protein [Bacteroidota bacterium]